jgi:hypothetical protein
VYWLVREYRGEAGTGPSGRAAGFETMPRFFPAVFGVDIFFVDVAFASGHIDRVI